MTKRYANLALVYAVIAMIFGVFYREYTKFNQFTGQTFPSYIRTILCWACFSFSY